MTEEARKTAKAMHQNECEDCIFDPTILGCRWRKEGTYCDTGLHSAADLIESLSAQLEQVTKERDAAVRDLERAEESADEVCRFLDDEVHPVCSYALYVDLHNAISEIVHWNNDEEWRGVEKEQ